MLETGQTSERLLFLQTIVCVLIHLCCFTPYFLQNTQINAIWPSALLHSAFFEVQHAFFIGNSNLCLSCEKHSQKFEFPHHFLEFHAAKSNKKPSLHLCFLNIITFLLASTTLSHLVVYMLVSLISVQAEFRYIVCLFVHQCLHLLLVGSGSVQSFWELYSLIYSKVFSAGCLFS